MRFELLNIRDERVQSFLWQWIEPTDFRHDYTRLDAIKEVERLIYAGECQLWGDLEANFMFRVVMRNPKVIEPHIMGDGSKIRTALALGLPICWEMGFERVAIWTQHEQIARIVQHLGFNLDGRLPGMHMDKDGNLLDLFVLTMTRTA